MTAKQLAEYWQLLSGDNQPITPGILKWASRPADQFPLPHAYMGDLLRFKSEDVDPWAQEEAPCGEELRTKGNGLEKRTIIFQSGRERICLGCWIEGLASLISRPRYTYPVFRSELLFVPCLMMCMMSRSGVFLLPRAKWAMTRTWWMKI